jgi:hypothetical protein
MVLAILDEPTRGRWGDSNRIAPASAPVLRDEMAAVATKQQYGRERLGYGYTSGRIHMAFVAFLSLGMVEVTSVFVREEKIDVQ